MQSETLIELGLVLVGLAIVARTATRLGIPTIPLYLVAGLAFGDGGIIPLVTTEEFVEIGAEIGLILLLFMLGLEYTAAELIDTVREQVPAGLLNVVLNFGPGLAMGLLLDWGPVAAFALGGVTYASSSGIVAKTVNDLGRTGNRETPVVLSVLVIEDLTMAVYLPLLAALLIGADTAQTLPSVAIALGAVIALLLVATRVEVGLSRLLFSRSDEALLLTILGLTVTVAGVAERVNVSAAVGALFVGIMLSGPAAQGARALLTPLRDLFAALFFAFFGLSVDPGTIPEGLAVATALAVLTGVTKFYVGWWSSRRAGVGKRGALRAGATLVARGEFSIAIAGVAVAAGVRDDLGAVAAGYVLILAMVGPVLARLADPLAERLFPSPSSPGVREPAGPGSDLP